VNAREQHAIDVEQRLHSARRFLQEQLPLRLREAEVVMRVMLCDDAVATLAHRMGEGLGVRAANRLQLRVLRRRVDDERREKLLQHVAILLEQQPEELPHVMAHDVHLPRASLSASDGERAGVRWNNHRLLDRFIADIQADDLFERQHMRAAQVKVRVRRRKPVKVRAADGGEQQRIRLRRDDAVKAWVNGHEWNMPAHSPTSRQPSS
jgi:hypothetical protein